MKVGPRLSIVSFNTIPNLYCDMFPSISLSDLNFKYFLIPEARILIAADAKEENTFQYTSIMQEIRMYLQSILNKDLLIMMI